MDLIVFLGSNHHSLIARKLLRSDKYLNKDFVKIIRERKKDERRTVQTPSDQTSKQTTHSNNKVQLDK
jgi:hypothetical protein